MLRARYQRIVGRLGKAPLPENTPGGLLTHIRLDVYVSQMKNRNPPEPAVLFQTLADPTRLRLLNLLGAGEVCVCDLHGTLGVTQPKVSRHLARLKRAGLVDARRNGKWMHYQLATADDPLIRHVLDGLRAWMNKKARLNSERRRLGKVCCRNDKTKGRQRKQTS